MTTANPGYPLAQLERALEGASSHPDAEVRARHRARVEQWRRVLGGMTSGELEIGSRTPTAFPAWVTLEVGHGGFATGALRAESPMDVEERELARRLGVEPTRRAVAEHLLSDAGRSELSALLASGLYRIEVPEEGALLAAVALLDRGLPEAAADIVDAIAPYLFRLRFAPRLGAQVAPMKATVRVATVAQTRDKLRRVETPLAVRQMHEALTVWAPLQDRAADLLFETWLDGAPTRVFPTGWWAKADQLIQDHAIAMRDHHLCSRPRAPRHTLALLMRCLARLRASGTLDARDLGLLRVVVLGHMRKHGEPGSERRRAQRLAQRRVASLPTRGDSAALLAARLADLPGDGGLASIDAVLRPFDDGAHAGVPVWPSVARKIERCLEASVDELVERGVLTSGEAVARVLPQVSAGVRALGFEDPDVARLHAAIDAAFRRRRSLLLFGYQAQVKLEELPWISALGKLRGGGGEGDARGLLASVVAIVVRAFPHAILPNPLLSELRALAVSAKLDVPVVDELAADIFMGGFTAKFVRAAALAATRLEGTLYSQYYALPTAQLVSMAATLSASAGPVPAFGALCARRAGVEGPRSVAERGCVIEQQQILTTQNLVPLITLAALDPAELPELAWRSFEWLVARVQQSARRRVHGLRAAKNAAYAWRQAIVYLSLAEPSAAPEFLARARSHVDAQREPHRTRLLRVVEGLERARAGQQVEPLLGWVRGPHPLLD